jgi:LacI family transcriptional regulator
VARRKQRTTILDVARLAGVSTASVSKVFNGARGVSEKTRLAVLGAAGKLDYHPNYVARSLRGKRTHTLGVVTDDMEGLFTMSLVRGIEEAIRVHDFSVILTNSYGDAGRERSNLEVLLAKQVDGVILMSGYKDNERSLPALPVPGLPLVYLYQYTRAASIPCVMPDDRGGGEMATRHLLGLGHRRIGLVNGLPSFEATHLRLEGYRQALQAFGAPYDPALVRWGEWTQLSAYSLTHELMGMPDPPTALFAASDLLAIGVADALHELRLRIPEEVSLVGFDNRFFSANQRPPLTTVALPLYEMGKLAGELIMASIFAEESQAKIHYVPCTLVERQSTAPCPAGLPVRLPSPEAGWASGSHPIAG